jgi:hypothetical protein
MSSMKVLLLGSTKPWALVIFGGGFGFSRSFFLFIHTSRKKKLKKKHLCNLLMHQLEVGVGISLLLIACVGSYLLSSIPLPPETQSMLPLEFSNSSLIFKISFSILVSTIFIQSYNRIKQFQSYFRIYST